MELTHERYQRIADCLPVQRGTCVMTTWFCFRRIFSRFEKINVVFLAFIYSLLSSRSAIV
jgi:hypothetical protein